MPPDKQQNPAGFEMVARENKNCSACTSHRHRSSPPRCSQARQEAHPTAARPAWPALGGGRSTGASSSSPATFVSSQQKGAQDWQAPGHVPISISPNPALPADAAYALALFPPAFQSCPLLCLCSRYFTYSIRPEVKVYNYY